MALIKIPSKNIYSMDDQKVIDNLVDKIEVAAKVPKLEYDFNSSVYSERVTEGFVTESTATVNNSDMRDLASGLNWQVAYASIVYTPTYITKEYKIPKVSGNAKIINLLVGADNSGNANIKYSMVGDIEKGYISDGSVVAVSTGSPYQYAKQFSFSQFKTGTPSINQWNYDESYSLNSQELLTYDFEYPLSNGENATLRVKAEIPPKADVFNVKVDNTDEDYYKLTFSILCGIKLYKLGGHTTVNNVTANTEKQLTLYGNYEEYIPKEVKVSFYGDTIKLVLENETIIVGEENGTNVISFNGNELMQKTNTPSIEETYGKIISGYKDGKEVATIRCAISDYYGEEDINIEILGYQMPDDNTYEYYIESNRNLSDVKYLYINGEKVTLYKTVFFGGAYGFTTDMYLEDGETYKATIEKKVISKSRENGLPMTIGMGDTVIPYVYDANGKDKPMALKEDGSAKQLNVIGKDIIYDGGIWQELILQEK